ALRPAYLSANQPRARSQWRCDAGQTRSSGRLESNLCASSTLPEKPLVKLSLNFAVTLDLLFKASPADEFFHLLAFAAAFKERRWGGPNRHSTHLENRRYPPTIPAGDHGLRLRIEPFLAIAVAESSRNLSYRTSDRHFLPRGCGFPLHYRCEQ